MQAAGDMRKQDDHAVMRPGGRGQSLPGTQHVSVPLSHSGIVPV